MASSQDQEKEKTASLVPSHTTFHCTLLRLFVSAEVRGEDAVDRRRRMSMSFHLRCQSASTVLTTYVAITRKTLNQQIPLIEYVSENACYLPCKLAGQCGVQDTTVHCV